MLTMVRTEAIPLRSMQAAMTFDWETYPQFMDTLDRLPKGVNLLPYVPMNPVLGYVMGIEESKTGRMPTDDEHATMRRILHEAMDAGACGWSAQRLMPDGPCAVQRDFDGSPMNTDVMHDETCLEMARVLGERGEGFQELTLASWDPKKDAEHFEQIAEVSGRPIMFEALVTNDRFPHRHRNTMRWLERCRQKGLPVYGQGVTTDAGLSFTFEDWNLFDDSDAWREATTGTVAERKEKLGDPRRREALKEQMPRESLITNYFDEIIITECEKPENKHLEGLTLRLAAQRNRQARGRHDARPSGVGGSQDRVLRSRGQLGRPDEGAARLSLYHVRRFRRRRAHQVPDRGPLPTEGLIRFVREKQWLTLEDIHWRLSGCRPSAPASRIAASCARAHRPISWFTISSG